MNPHKKLTTAQAALYLGLSVSTLKNLRASGEGPAWFKPTDAINSPVLYEVFDLDTWVRERKNHG